MEQQTSKITVLNTLPPEPEKQKLGTYEILVPKVYADLFRPIEIRKFILASGRISGKTSILVSLIYTTLEAYPNFDIVLLQATTTEIKSSIINELREFYENKGFDVGDKPSNTIYIPKSNDSITIQDGRHKGGIYIYPITDSNGGQRTRGIKLKNPCSLVLFEEAQKNRNRNVVEQAIATFVRQSVDKRKYPDFVGTKIIIAGNNETAGHWFTTWVNEKRKDKSFEVIYANCYDIWKLLNKDTQDYILQFKKVNYGEYKRQFLGDTNAVDSDVVFPQFVPKKDYLLQKDIPLQDIIRVIIGIDHATANDTYTVIPLAILEDGTCQTLQICYDDPKESGRSISPVEQCQLLDKFLEWLDEYYGFSETQVRLDISCDGAASAFIAQLRHTKRTSRNKIWKYITIHSFTKKKKKFNIHIIQNALAYGVLKILNEGVYSWNGRKNTHRLRKELQALRYNAMRKLDPTIPNDFTDGLEYAVVPYYTNCYNLSFPVRRNEKNKLKEMRDYISMEERTLRHGR